MDLNKLYKVYEEWDKLFEQEKEKYDKILKIENEEESERISDMNFTPDEKEVIARTNYFLSEREKTKQIAVFAEFLGIDFDDSNKFKSTDNYNLMLSSLKTPLLVVDNGEVKVNKKEDWENYKFQQIENFKEYFKMINKNIV